MKVGYGTIITDCSIDKTTTVWHHCNLFRCRIGRNCTVGSFVEIGEGVSIGDNCKIEAYTFIPKGVTIGDNVFVGPHVVFTNDKFPRATGEWSITPTYVRDGASIGANSTILSGVEVGKKAMIGAASVVTKNVPENAVVYGPEAEVRRTIH
jgi:acetyltransferase-like isoleucine patch superfamily enzyme